LLFFDHFGAPERFCLSSSEIINKKGINPPFCFARTCGNASAAAEAKQRALAKFSRFPKHIGNQRQTTR
jgi:hypothetical protein